MWRLTTMPYVLCTLMSNLQTELDDFRRTHLLQTCEINGHRWEFVTAGDGEQVLLMLPGALAAAEAAFRHIRHFELRFKIISVAYPPTLKNLNQAIDGIAALVRQHTDQPMHVIGGSYSGLTAQALLRRYPELISKIVLADTGVPRRNRARGLAVFVPFLRWLPLALLRLIWVRGMASFARGINEEQEFWQAFFRARVLSLQRGEWLSHLAMWCDFDRQIWQPLHDFAGEILIIETMHDAVFRHAEQRTLRELYPTASIHTFTDVSHSAPLKNYAAYIAVIEEFLKF